MSSIWKKPTSSVRQQELNWLNIIYQSHDQICHCDNPNKHLLICLNKFNNWKKPESEITNILCLLTGKPTEEEDTDKDTDPVTGFTGEELEKLFEETTASTASGEDSER